MHQRDGAILDTRRLAGLPVSGLPSAAEPGEVSPDDPAALAIQVSLAQACRRITESDPAARRGEPEGVHRLRTSTRRLRSELRTYDGLVERAWAEALEGELKWLAGKLGEVRDLDVMRGRLCEAAGDSAAVLAPLFDRIAERHARASEALGEALASARYRELVEAIARGAEEPRLEEDAVEPCRTALPPLVRKAWRRLKTCGRALEPGRPDEEFHETRKRAKRARYAAEAVGPALPSKRAKQAARFAKRVTKLQNALGELQDAVVAAEEIHRAVLDRPDDRRFHLAARRLSENEETAARKAREASLELWLRLDRKRNVRWMKG